MKLRWIIPLAWVLVIFGTVGVTQAAGWWSASGREEVVAGTLTPEDVKGWMTVQQAADGLGMPAEVIIDAIGAPAGVVQPSTAFKDIEAVVPDFSLDDFRVVLTDMLGGSASPSSTPSAPSAPPASAASPSPAPTATHQPTGAGTGDQTVTGQQTLRQVAEANRLDLPTLIAEAGLPPEVNPDVALRTLRDTIPGFEMQQVRDAVARLS